MVSTVTTAMPAGTAPVTVVVVTFNSRVIIGDCLRSLAAQRAPPRRVIVVDNHSMDGTADLVATEHPDVTLVRLSRNTGFAAGNNVGIRAAFEDPECEYVALLNADARLDADWLAKLLSFARAHLDGAGFQGLTLRLGDPGTVDSRGLTIGRSGVPLQIDFSRPRAARYDSGPVFGVNAAAALLSRRFLEAQPFADYFDEDLFMYLEDVDLAARAAVMGWKSYFVADAIAYHVGSASKRRHTATRLLHRNSGLVLLKNFPWPVLARMLGGAVANEARTLARYLRRDGPVPVAAALVGRLESLRYVARFLGKRRRLRKHWAVSPDDLWAVIVRAQGTARPAPAVTPPPAV